MAKRCPLLDIDDGLMLAQLTRLMSEVELAIVQNDLQLQVGVLGQKFRQQADEMDVGEGLAAQIHNLPCACKPGGVTSD